MLQKIGKKVFWQSFFVMWALSFLLACEPIANSPQNAGQDIGSLTAQNYGGSIEISNQDIKDTEGGFSLPVVGKNILESDKIDTLTMALDLPAGIRLDSWTNVKEGFTVQVEGKETQTPNIYFYSSATTGENYKVVTANDSAIFDLHFTGERKGEIGFSGSFFNTTGIKMDIEKMYLKVK